MLSIIVCSVNRKYLLNFEKNVAETIGDNVEYEILAIDNKVMRLSICAAYNRAASEARYPYLLFIHEDVEFLEKGWWAKVMPQLSKPDCGVIGFAGTVAMVDSPAGWGQSRKWSVLNFTQLTKVGDAFTGKVLKTAPIVRWWLSTASLCLCAGAFGRRRLSTSSCSKASIAMMSTSRCRSISVTRTMCAEWSTFSIILRAISMRCGSVKCLKPTKMARPSARVG